MSKSFLPAIAATALMLCAAPAALLAGEAPAAPQVSAAATKAMRVVQQAAEAQKYPEVIAGVDEVLKVEGRTPADTFVAYQFLAHAYEKQGDKTGLLKALQGQLDAGYADATEQNRINAFMMRIAFEQKDYVRSAEYGTRLIQSGAPDPAVVGLVGHSLFLQGKHAESAKLLSDHVADQEGRGLVPREQALNTLYSAQEKNGDKAAVNDSLEKLVKHYPKPEYWTLLLFAINRDPVLTEKQSLQIYRLIQTTQSFSRCAEFIEMAEIAVNMGVPGEGQKAVELGLAHKSCAEKANQERLLRLQTSTNTAAAEDKAGLSKLETEAKAAKTGELEIVAGTSLFGYGEYARAIEALSRGIAKGGLKNPSEAQIMLGMAQVRGGAKADAVQTFGAVKVDDAFTQRVVRLWGLYAAQ
jgi:hypothetical protein